MHIRSTHILATVFGALFLVLVQPGNAQQGPLPVTVAKPLLQKIVEWDE